MSNTIHDMGGMHGFGPVEPEPNEPVFHEPWEGRVLAMQRAMGYTRLPRYARDKLGTVEAVRGCHVYPDTAAIGAGDHPQWLYTVVFPARELWGEAADPTVSVSIEAFEPYLEPA